MKTFFVFFMTREVSRHRKHKFLFKKVLFFTEKELLFSGLGRTPFLLRFVLEKKVKVTFTLRTSENPSVYRGF